jgi:hypothetical protein
LTGENVGVRVTYVLVVQLPAEGVASFQRYESAVLPLLAEHHGTLERRLQTQDHQTEVHVVSFPSIDYFERYRNDPRRVGHSHLLQESNARVEIYAMSDVTA